MNNVTIYNILFPIAGLHPDATRKAEALYCLPLEQRDQVLNDWFVYAKPIPQQKKACDSPVAQNVALAKTLGFNGTPMIVSMDGRILPGAVEQAKLEEFLSPRL
jgi:thiol:disulfide interchange protein DsbC